MVVSFLRLYPPPGNWPVIKSNRDQSKDPSSVQDGATIGTAIKVPAVLLAWCKREH